MVNEDLVLDVTAVGQTATFAASCYYVEIYNSGTDSCYINFNAAATTDHFQLFSGETLKIFTSVTTVRGICDAGETATLYITGSR